MCVHLLQAVDAAETLHNTNRVPRTSINHAIAVLEVPAPPRCNPQNTLTLLTVHEGIGFLSSEREKRPRITRSHHSPGAFLHLIASACYLRTRQAVFRCRSDANWS